MRNTLPDQLSEHRSERFSRSSPIPGVCVADQFDFDFFVWCESQGLRSDREIATLFCLSSQTIKNWRQNPSGVPRWIFLPCLVYERLATQTISSPVVLPRMTASWFECWRNRNGLTTYDQVGGVFGLTRQAVHNWSRRGRFPSYVPLVCIGYEVYRLFDVRNGLKLLDHN